MMGRERLLDRAARVRLLLMDCDGVLTDGRIYLLPDGEEMKAFHVRDGHGLVMWHSVGRISAIVSGRSSKVVERRGHELGISFVRQGVDDKLAELTRILTQTRLSAEQAAFIGDDLADIPLMKRVGLAIAVADASEEVRRIAHYVTRLAGGHGAVREVTELLLKAQGKWAEALNHYLEEK
jgi:3-deoxy-D-manno-octulosonate 8-phosphate phosphatase (KDO 8-P phosphatase)